MADSVAWKILGDYQDDKGLPDIIPDDAMETVCEYLIHPEISDMLEYNQCCKMSFSECFKMIVKRARFMFDRYDDNYVWNPEFVRLYIYAYNNFHMKAGIKAYVPTDAEIKVLEAVRITK